MNDIDIWRKALKKIDLTEAAAPVIRGRMLLEDSQVEIYNKIQKLLNCRAMESAHNFLYNLDPTDLSESESTRVCNLYRLGIDRGFIEEADDSEENSEEHSEENKDNTNECDLVAEPVKDVQTPLPTAAPSVPLRTCAFTIMYSATRDGQIKTGEAYSNCINTRSAKLDVLNKLERAGYSNISILAIEACDPDMCGCDDTQISRDSNVVPDYTLEADDREPMNHILDPYGIKASTANLAGQNAVKFTTNEDEIDEEDVSEQKAQVKNAFEQAQKEIQSKNTPAQVKKVLDDNSEQIKKVKFFLQKYGNKKASDNFQKILSFLEDYASGKISEDEIDEAKKPSTGILTIVRGLLKIVLTLIKLCSKGGDILGKVISYISKIIGVGADKLNVMLKDSDDQINEDSDSEDDKEDSDSEDDDKEDSDSEDDDKEDSDSKDDSENDDKEDDSKDDKEEDAEEPDEKLKDDTDADKAEDKDSEDGEELSISEKETLKDSYRKAFKAAMQKCKFETSFSDLTLEQKVEFFTALNKAWGNKADPSKFMTDKEIQQLEKIVVKK